MIIRVFRIIAISIILAAVLDTTMVVWSAIFTYNKMSNVVELAQTEVSRHNCVTDEMGKVLDKQVEEIVKTTPVPAIISGGQKNFGEAISVNALQGQSTAVRDLSARTTVSIDLQDSPGTGGTGAMAGHLINEANVGKYGDIKQVDLLLTVDPLTMFFGTNDKLGVPTTRNGNLELLSPGERTWGKIDLRITREVPCLRYTK